MVKRLLTRYSDRTFYLEITRHTHMISNMVEFYPFSD